MKVIVTWDGDHIGRMVGRARLADEIGEVRRIGQSIDQGNRVWESWVTMNGGSMIEAGGDEGSAEIPAEKLNELPKVRDQYATAVGSTVSVGVGTKLSEADRALMVAKIRGGDKIVLYTKDLEEEIAAAEKAKQGQSETDKLAEEYLQKSQGKLRGAAFMHKPTGQVYETGAYHSIDPWLRGGAASEDGHETGPHNSSDWEAGFVTHDGQFLNREDAARFVNAQPRVNPITGQDRLSLDSQDPEAGLRKDEGTAPQAPQDPAMAQGNGAGFAGASPAQGPTVQKPKAEASEHSQGEAAQAQMDDQPKPAEATHAAEDFENMFHDLAQEQSAKDSGVPSGGDPNEQLKAQVVQVLQALKAQAPILEQIKNTAPDTYQAIMGMAQSVIAMAKRLNGDQQGTTVRELDDRARSNAQVEVPLPPEEGDEGGDDKKDKKKEGKTEKSERPFDLKKGGEDISGPSASDGPRPKVKGAEHVRKALDVMHAEIDHRYNHIWHHATKELGMHEDDVTTQDGDLVPEHCTRCQAFPIDQEEIGRCTSTAAHLAKQLRGKVMGYPEAPEIGAELGEGEGEGGHDFAVINGRYIADWWANSYHSAPDLHDMQDPKQQKLIRKLYGDPSKWTAVYDFEKNPEQPHHWESVKKSEGTKYDCEDFGHCWGTDSATDYCVLCGENRADLEQDLDKASLSPNAGMPAQHHHLNLPVGSKEDPGVHARHRRAGRIKVMHPETGKQGWVEARAGQVMSRDGHPISARNPNGK